MSDVAAISAESLSHFVSQRQGSYQLDLFLKGVKCGHCVHKITQNIQHHPHLTNFKFEAEGRRLSLWVDQTDSFFEILDRIRSLGFGAVPIDHKQFQSQELGEYKRELKKLAVAGVCAGNIMLFSLAVYLGADPAFKLFFHKLSFILAIPVLSYSASSIWFGFYQSLKNLKFNLDFPIGLALLLGFSLSATSYFGNQAHLYFDSMAVVVFVILASRFILNRYVENIKVKNHVQLIPGAFQARLISNESEIVVPIESVTKGVFLKIKRGEVTPVDSQLISEQAVVDMSVITGESSPVILKKGDTLYAGGRLTTGEVIVESLNSARDSRVGQYIQSALETESQAHGDSFKIVEIFTGLVIGTSLLSFGLGWYFIDLYTGFTRAFAIVLVACPCAVSFGIPLIRSLTGHWAMKNGFIVKSPQDLKKLRDIKHIVFDKTGTLTETKVAVSKSDFQRFSAQDQQKILALELSMNHPISNGFKEFRDPHKDLLVVENFQYHPGRGISGIVEGENWRISSYRSEGGKQVAAYKNEQLIGVIGLKSSLKNNIKSFFKALTDKGYAISVLSGDDQASVAEIEKLVPTRNRGQFLHSTTPEEKQNFISSVGEKTLMIGDGINDLMALKSANLSVCMPGPLEDNLRVSDISMIDGSLETLDKIFRLGQKLQSSEKRLFTFTFTYNVLCIIAASLGFVTPVVAAILMPISSVTVLSIITLSMRGN